MRRGAAACAALLLLAACAGPDQKQDFLPQAQNDYIEASVGGFAEGSSAPTASLPLEGGQPMQIETRPAKERYPVDSAEAVLVVTNHSDRELLYSEWFDFRRIEGEQVLPLTPREGEMVNAGGESLVLAPGASVELTVPLDIFEEPLTPGVYRVSQLACYADDFACTEITADLILQ